MDVDPTDLSQSGWAVVFTPDTPDAVRKALQPLIELRARQVPPDRHKVLEYKPGESREAWLGKYGARGSDAIGASGFAGPAHSKESQHEASHGAPRCRAWPAIHHGRLVSRGRALDPLTPSLRRADRG